MRQFCVRFSVRFRVRVRVRVRARVRVRVRVRVRGVRVRVTLYLRFGNVLWLGLPSQLCQGRVVLIMIKLSGNVPLGYSQ
jgi:hypothetical protein